MHHPFYHRNLTCLLSLKTGCVAAVLGEFEGESGYLVEDTPINLSVCSLSLSVCSPMICSSNIFCESTFVGTAPLRPQYENMRCSSQPMRLEAWCSLFRREHLNGHSRQPSHYHPPRSFALFLAE